MKHIYISIVVLLTLCFLPSLVCSDAITGPQALPSRWWKIGDGLRGDSTDVTTKLQEILDLAATRTGYLRLDSGVYLLTDSIVVPEGVTFEGNHAKLQWEISGETKALCLESNTRVSGFIIDVDSVNAITGHGAHGAPINIGEYGDGTGYSNIEMSDLTLHTEKIDGNGIFITGNSYDIDITNIYFPNSVNMGRSILCHWGNTAYDVAEDTGRTYHPHNIDISNITIDTMFQESPQPYAVGVYLSGCYNIDIEKVTILRAGKAFHAFVGDVGYRYADPKYLDTSVIDGQGITLSKIFLNEATLVGFSVDGLSPVLDTATGISDSDAVWDLPVHFSNSVLGSNGNNNGVLLSNCRNVVIDNCVFDGFANGFATGVDVINTKILNSTFRNLQNHGISLSNSATSTSSPQDITVDNCFLYNNGLADSTAYAGIRVADASRCIITNNRIGLTAGEWLKYGILITQEGAGHIATNNHVFDVSGGGSAYSFVSGDSTLVLSWGNTAASGLDIPPPRVMYDTTKFTGIVFAGNRFKTDGPGGIVADFKSSDPVATRVLIANTDTGIAAIYFDAIDGDFTGADYARIGQDDSGYFEFVLEPTAPNWAFRFTDATNIYFTVDKSALTIGAYALPMTDGTADQVLTTDGSGAVSWNTQVGAGAGTADSLGIDTDGDGTVDNYLYSTVAGCAHIKKGSNITLTVAGDTVTIAGDAAAGTADSMGVDTDGDGTVDAYLYSTVAGAFHLKEGAAMSLVVAGDTVTLGVVTAGGDIDNKGVAAFPSTHFTNSAGLITIPANRKFWMEGSPNNDTLFLVDDDGDTLCAFWDDDAGNVRWQVGTEDQSLRILVDTIEINGEVIYSFTGTNLSVTDGVLNASGAGTTDSTYINDGTQYGPFLNDMYKIKEGTGVNIVREDSTTYDVFKFHATLGTSVEYGEITATTSANWNGLVSDNTGSGSWVFGTSPTISGPTLTLETGAGSSDQGRILWNTTNKAIVVGTGGGEPQVLTFYSGSHEDSTRILLTDRLDTTTGGIVLHGGADITMTGTETVDGKDVSTLTDIGQTVDSTEVNDSTLSLDDLNWEGGLSDSRIQNNITVNEASDVDTGGTKIAVALGTRMDNTGDTVTGTYDFSGGILDDIDVISADTVRSSGDIYINYDGGEGNSQLYFYDNASPTGAWFRWNNTDNKFEFNKDFICPHLFSNGHIYANHNGPDGDIKVFFYEGASEYGAYLMWDDAPTGEFVFSHPLGDASISDALTVTGYMQDEDINTFNELQSWVSDKTLLNEEDAATIDVGWTFAGLLAADSTNTDHLVSSDVYLGNDTIKGVDVLVVDTVVVDGDVIKDFTGTNLTVTDGVLSASGAGEANILVDTGTFDVTSGFGLTQTKVDVELRIRGLIEGSNITIAQSGDTGLTIAASGAGLTYFTEADDNDTSVFTATGPNTTVGLNDNLTMQGNDITGVGNLTVVTGITVPNNSISPAELDEAASFTWTGTNTFGNTVFFDDGVGASPALTLRDQDNKDMIFAKYDEGYSVIYNNEGANRFYASGDVDDYIYFDTFAANVPMISTGGNCDLVINASSGEISFGDDNLTTTGTLDAGATSVTGNIVVTGTVDGLDVSKLDSTLDGYPIDTATAGGSNNLDDGDILEWNAANSEWRPTAQTGGDGLDTTEVLDILRDSISGDATVGAGGALTVVDDLHDHVYSNIDATTSANWATRVDNETGTGAWVFGTSPTFTTDITSPLVIGGTGTASDLSLKTTSGVGATGADMHFLVGDNGATEAMTILNNGNVGIGKTNPDEILYLFGNNATLKFEDDSENKATINVGNSQLCIAIDPSGLVASSDICFDIDGDEVARFHQNTNFGIGIGATIPPERITVVGNIATGDTTTGDVDVFHRFSRDGDWSAAYLKLDDGLGRFEFSHPLDVTGNITVSGTVDTVDLGALAAKVHRDTSHFIFAFSNPNAVYDTDSLLCIKPVTEKAITITRIDVTCDADPATEPAMKLNHTDNFISRTSPTTIDVITTTNGVTTITSGFDDATIPATRCIYFAFTADPIAAIKSITVDITYTID